MLTHLGSGGFSNVYLAKSRRGAGGGTTEGAVLVDFVKSALVTLLVTVDPPGLARHGLHRFGRDLYAHAQLAVFRLLPDRLGAAELPGLCPRLRGAGLDV